MNRRILTTIGATRKAVTRLIDRCRKGSPLYSRSPRAAAHVSRTAKWLLNAIAALHRELDAAHADEDRQAP